MIHSFFLEKSFLVTGASSGIGRALVLELNRNGAVVGAIARRKELLKELKVKLSFQIKSFLFPETFLIFLSSKRLQRNSEKKLGVSME